MIEAGLYKHYDGNYYMVTQIARNTREEWEVILFNACHPEYGIKSVPVEDFEVEVTKSAYNPDNQEKAYERVVDLSLPLKNFTTKALIEELKRRSDSPFQESDLEGLNSSVICRDYIIGEKMYNSDLELLGIDTLNVFEDEDRAKNKFENMATNRNTFVFKRVFVEVE